MQSHNKLMLGDATQMYEKNPINNPENTINITHPFDTLTQVEDFNQHIKRIQKTTGNKSMDQKTILNPEIREIISKKGLPIIELEDISATPEIFSEALNRGIDANPHGVMVWRRSPEEIAGDTLLLSKDQSTGVRIGKDGEIGSLFKNTAISTAKNILPSMMLSAIAVGGTKGECYGENMMRQYMQLGFVPVAHTRWSEKDLQNGSTWDQKFGYPDMYFFILPKNLDVETCAKEYGNRPEMSDEELEKLPILGYDGETPEAYAYRDAIFADDSQKAQQILENFSFSTPENL